MKTKSVKISKSNNKDMEQIKPQHFLMSNLAEVLSTKSIEKHFFSVIVKVISYDQIKAAGKMMVVADNSASIPIKFSPSMSYLENSMKVGTVYHLLHAKLENDSAMYLYMDKGSYAVDVGEDKFPEILPMHITPKITSVDLMNIAKNNVFVHSEMILKLKSVYKKKDFGENNALRTAKFYDEFNDVNLTVWAPHCQELDKLNQGDLYKISKFKTNYWTNNLTGKPDMGITFIPNKTKIIKIQQEETDERIEKIRELSNKIQGQVFAIYNFKTYRSCKKCKKSVEYSLEKVCYSYEQSTGLAQTPPTCVCGENLETDANYEWSYYVDLVIQNENSIKPVKVFNSVLEPLRSYICETYDEPIIMDDMQVFLDYLMERMVHVTYEEIIFQNAPCNIANEIKMM